MLCASTRVMMWATPLCRLHWLLRNDTPGSNVRGRIVTPKEDISAAVKLTLSASQEDLERQDTDEWWREHRAGCSFRVPPYEKRSPQRSPRPARSGSDSSSGEQSAAGARLL